MTAARQIRLAPSPERRAKRIASTDRARSRKHHDALRDLATKRHLAEVDLQAARIRIIGRSPGFSLRDKLDPGLPTDEQIRIAKLSNPTTPTQSDSESEPRQLLACERPIEVEGGEALKVRERYELLDDLRTISTKRTRTCGRKRISNTVQFSTRDGVVKFTGVEHCCNIHGCPVCAAKLYARRGLEVDTMVDLWIGPGEHRIGPEPAWAGMITLTIRHGLGDELAVTQRGLADAFRYLFSGRAGQELKRELKLEHYVRSYESTLGPNGWHPHLHVVTLCTEPPSPDTLRRLRERWRDCVERALGSSHTPALDIGCDVRPLVNGKGSYITKMGLEVAGGYDTKAASHGNRTYWQVAKDAAQGDRRSIALWKEAQKALFGTRQLTWSRGTRGKFGLPDLDDAALLASSTDESTEGSSSNAEPGAATPPEPMRLEIAGTTWDAGCRRDRRFLTRVVAAVAWAAETGDWSGVLALLRDSSSSDVGLRLCASTVGVGSCEPHTCCQMT